MWSIPRWAILLLGAALLVFGLAVHMGWLRDPSLAKADYVGNIDVSAADAKLYRAVPFEWRVTSNAGSFTGNDTAYVCIDDSGERPMICGWLRLDKGGNSIRATRWSRFSYFRAPCRSSAHTTEHTATSWAGV